MGTWVHHHTETTGVEPTLIALKVTLVAFSDDSLIRNFWRKVLKIILETTDFRSASPKVILMC